MSELHKTDDKEMERAILVGVWVQGKNEEWEVRDTLEELAQLTDGAGAIVLSKVLCKQSKIHAGHFIGTGKAAEIAKRVLDEGANLVVFDENLSPAQGRNLEEVLGVRVVDRTQLILDIFAQRARTREGCLQVELAQHLYLLPRLRNMWTHLERQKGGIGMKGPGEMQIEMDRRRIEELIITLKKELELVQSRRAELRRGRRRGGWALVSLVGYTNAGKSTLLNKLSGSDIYVKDQLFATLDPTTRQVELPNREQCLITDTVGFIRKLPHHLVKSFKATLEEVAESDLILHVIDCSHPQVEQQIEAVNVVLQDIGAADKPVLCVLNKIDTELGANVAHQLANRLGRSVAVSALNGDHIEALLHELSVLLKGDKVLMNLSIPLSEGRLLAMLQSSAIVLEEKYEGPHAEVLARVPLPMVPRCEPYRVES